MKLRFAWAGLLVLALAACGGGDDPAPADTGNNQNTGGNNTGGNNNTGGSTFTPPGTTTAGTVNAGLAGSYSLHYFKGTSEGCTTHCSFTEGQAVAVTVSADGKLSIAGKELTNPFYRSFGGQPNTFEVIWLDADAKVEYALSDNKTPHFNEINVGDASRPTNAAGVPTFLGQIR